MLAKLAVAVIFIGVLASLGSGLFFLVMSLVAAVLVRMVEVRVSRSILR